MFGNEQMIKHNYLIITENGVNLPVGQQGKTSLLSNKPAFQWALMFPTEIL